MSSPDQPPCIFRLSNGKLDVSRAAALALRSARTSAETWCYCGPSLCRHLLYDGHFFSVEVAHNQQGRHLLVDHWPVVLYVERADGKGWRRRLGRVMGVREGMDEIRRQIEGGEWK